MHPFVPVAPSAPPAEAEPAAPGTTEPAAPGTEDMEAEDEQQGEFQVMDSVGGDSEAPEADQGEKMCCLNKTGFCCKSVVIL